MEKKYKVLGEIYEKSVIQQSILDFSSVAEISYNSDILSIAGESEEEVQEVFHEFMNYVLSI